LIFHQPKGCFLSDRQKSPEFYAIKNVKKKKAYSGIKKKKKKKTAPPGTADPKKVKKSILIFANFFSIFVSGSSMRLESSQDSPFRSEY